jgi:hypothetical protein
LADIEVDHAQQALTQAECARLDNIYQQLQSHAAGLILEYRRLPRI